MSKSAVLVVDDEPVVRNLCETILRNHKFKTIAATNGLEGLKAYREHHQDICLVLSDVLMPMMSGIEMTQKLLEVDAHPNIILMSGANLHNLVPHELKKLCSVLQKPFTASVLLDAVNRCLQYEEKRHPDRLQ